MALTVDEILRLMNGRGQQQYGGEAVSQLEHALQCADLAEQAGESAETVVAALLHDLGHLLVGERAAPVPSAEERDDLHQYFALPFLRGLFPPAVLEPIRMHVDAKRYLCTAEPAYHASLSPASQRSLTLQGGAYTDTQASAFIGVPFAAEAVRLRRYDDLAKVPGKRTQPLAHFAQCMERLARPDASASPAEPNRCWASVSPLPISSST